MVEKSRATDGQAAATSDWYVTGGVNWPGFTLLELVTMVAQGASVPQLERLALDWRNAGDGIVDTADFLADALADLMNYWTGTSAEAARNTVALNAQWVLDLGVTARDMSGPIDESAGALKAAQEAMPQLPEAAQLAALQGQEVQQAPAAQGATFQQAAVAQQASAPINAQRAAALTGSPMGGAVGATAAGSRSAFADQAEQGEAKRVAVETMQRFESATVGIDRATPRFLGQNSELVPRDDLINGPGDEGFADQVARARGLDKRWDLLTKLPLDATTAQRLAGIDGANLGLISGNFTGVGGIGGGGAGAMNLGPITGNTSGIPGIGGEAAGGAGGGAVPAARGGVLPTSAAGAIGAANSAHGMAGPVGAAPMAGGAGAAAAHRRRVPYDADDPFDTGQKASPPVIGL
jgi:hypothetical protein